jgi:ribulose-5-phosphate 4-epimerase/fuculose-1-phosphate aldolase
METNNGIEDRRSATHISMRVPGDAEHFVINPLGLRYDEITVHHGLLTVGSTIGEAFTSMFWLTKACRIQMQVLASTQFTPGHDEWPALVRKLDDIDPSYRM